jgi:hypothetical protein
MYSLFVVGVLVPALSLANCAFELLKFDMRIQQGEHDKKASEQVKFLRNESPKILRNAKISPIIYGTKALDSNKTKSFIESKLEWHSDGISNLSKGAAYALDNSDPIHPSLLIAVFNNEIAPLFKKADAAWLSSFGTVHDATDFQLIDQVRIFRVPYSFLFAPAGLNGLYIDPSFRPQQTFVVEAGGPARQAITGLNTMALATKMYFSLMFGPVTKQFGTQVWYNYVAHFGKTIEAEESLPNTLLLQFGKSPQVKELSILESIASAHEQISEELKKNGILLEKSKP